MFSFTPQIFCYQLNGFCIKYLWGDQGCLSSTSKYLVELISKSFFVVGVKCKIFLCDFTVLHTIIFLFFFCGDTYLLILIFTLVSYIYITLLFAGKNKRKVRIADINNVEQSKLCCALKSMILKSCVA